MSRLTVIDGFRGFFLLFMGVFHFNTVLDTVIGKVNHHNLGWVEDAQGFVFISGLVVGPVYGRKHLRAGSLRESFRPILARVRTIYLHQLGLVLILLAAALVLGPLASRQLMPYVEAPVAFTIASLGLTTASGNMGILPMYIVFLFFVPFAFRMLQRGWDIPFALVLALGWMLGQSGLAEFLADGVQGALGLPFRFALGFNLFSWQVLFFGGLWFGFRMACNRLDLSFLAQDQYRVAFLISAGAIVALAALDRIVGWNLIGGAFSQGFTEHTDRGQLAWIYPIAFLIDLFAIVWLMRVGITDRSRWIRALGKGLTWLFTRRALVFLGQHSLHVFSFHILIYYLLAQVIPGHDLSEGARTLILLVSVAALYLAAAFHAAHQAWDLRARERAAG